MIPIQITTKTNSIFSVEIRKIKLKEAFCTSYWNNQDISTTTKYVLLVFWIRYDIVGRNDGFGLFAVAHADLFFEFRELGEPVVNNAGLVFTGVHTSLRPVCC